MIYHNNTLNLNVKSFIPTVLDMSGELSLQELKRWNDQDSHWLHLKLDKLEKHIHQIEVFVAQELKEVSLSVKKRVKLINRLFHNINSDFTRLSYYDEKSKNLLLGDIDDALIKLKKFVSNLENDISTISTNYNSH